ncbi:(2Fe-2S)-binding protein [Undibacterium sp. TJN19]|uniref:(2Fe-2S)-binding protein n=1 Tax=Undibacterium sp. TJN19 TaxID=3413055 RepID=UPI003BEFE964
MEININGQQHNINIDGKTPLLWAIREILGLTGTKFACGIAACGACTVHINGNAVRSCSFPVEAAKGQEITTIEALSRDRSHPLQQAWINVQVPQCGYCQSGMLMTAAALIKKIPQPNDQQINEAMTNICRCGSYHRVRIAIKKATRQAV